MNLVNLAQQAIARAQQLRPDLTWTYALDEDLLEVVVSRGPHRWGVRIPVESIKRGQPSAGEIAGVLVDAVQHVRREEPA